MLIDCFVYYYFDEFNKLVSVKVHKGAWMGFYLTDMHITENYWGTLKCQQKDFYCICRQNGYIFNVYIFSHFMIFFVYMKSPIKIFIVFVKWFRKYLRIWNVKRKHVKWKLTLNFWRPPYFNFGLLPVSLKLNKTIKSRHGDLLLLSTKKTSSNFTKKLT